MQPRPDSRPAAQPELAESIRVVLNNGSRAAAAGGIAATRHLLEQHGLRHARVRAVGGRELPSAIDEALAEEPGMLVIGGGDGSVGYAAGRVAGTSTQLGVLPLGTANDFARTLGLPTDLTGAVRTLVDGQVVDVDLGWVSAADVPPAPFLNVASIGLSVGVTERLTPRLKRRLGPLAYPAATVAAYRHHAPFAARLEFPDGDHPAMELDDLLQVAVGNGRHYGGGNTVSPTASVDDHLLDLYAIVRGRWREHVSIARLLRDGSFIEHDRVHHLTTRRVMVSTDRPMSVNLDGEIAATSPVEFSVDRNALHVVVPRTSLAVGWDG